MMLSGMCGEHRSPRQETRGMVEATSSLTALLHRGARALTRSREAREIAMRAALDDWCRPRTYVWISVAAVDGTACAARGTIGLGETLYEIASDGREIHLDAECGRRHMRRWRSGRAVTAVGSRG
jgi:hypothetical protein